LPGRYGVLADNRDPLLLGHGSAALTANLYDVALTAAYLLTHSVATAAAFTCGRLLPSTLFLSLTGALVDRLDRRRLLVGSLLGQAACRAGIVAADERGTLPLAVLCAFVTAALAGPARGPHHRLAHDRAAR